MEEVYNRGASSVEDFIAFAALCRYWAIMEIGMRSDRDCGSFSGGDIKQDWTGLE